MSAADLNLDTAEQICGPQLPAMQDVRLARAMQSEADLAGCSDAVYDRLTLECQQTELAYLHGRDRDLIRDLEAESGDPEVARAEIRRDDPEAGLGHDYDGPELRSGTPEYEALYAEYRAWAAQPEAEPEAGL